MKKICILPVFVFCSVFTMFAGDNALGVRLGYGGEVSYQHSLGSYNRLEVNAGWNSNYLGLAGLYHRVFDLSALGDGFKWYVGVGAALSINDKEKFALGAAGNIGIEYNFKIPIQISLDYRPTFYLIPGTKFCSTGIGLGIRYRF